MLLMYISCFLFLTLPVTTFAQGNSSDCANNKFGCFEVPLPGITDKSIDNFVKKDGGIGLVGYVSFIAKIITGVIIATALIIVVAAGYVYMTAGGDGGKVELAKSMIKAALLGIILALGAYLILNTISPQFASKIKEPVFGSPTPGSSSSQTSW